MTWCHCSPPHPSTLLSQKMHQQEVMCCWSMPLMQMWAIMELL
ncbi:hypothetical protein SRHO_G00192300, partial [Serrasalmus rhombeus]